MNPLNPRQVTITLQASSPGDAVRIITLPSAGCAALIDFDALQNAGSGAYPVSEPYIEDGFEIAPAAPYTGLAILGDSDPKFSGSTALHTTHFVRADLVLRQLSDAPFDVCSVDVTELDSPTDTALHWVFGERILGPDTSDPLALDGDGGWLPQRVSLPNLVQLDRAHFSRYRSAPNYQIDNICICQAVQRCVNAPLGLVAWWTGDDCLGTDRTGSHHGTYSPPQSCPFDQIARPRPLSFDSVQSQILTVPHDPEIEPGSGEFSLDLWIRPTAADLSASLVTLIDKANAYTLSLSSGVPQLHLFSNSGIWSLSSSVGPLIANDWQFLAFVLKRDGGGDTLTLYHDTASSASTGSPGTIGSAFDLLIGGDPFGSMTFFDGEMDEIEIFDRALSVSEVATLQAAAERGKCKAMDSVFFAGTGSGSPSSPAPSSSSPSLERS